MVWSGAVVIVMRAVEERDGAGAAPGGHAAAHRNLRRSGRRTAAGTVKGR
jgi:hypothetical protein